MRKTYLPQIFPQKVTLSSLLFLSPDLWWTWLPQFSPLKAMPQFLCFIEKGYAKIVWSQGQNENQENQDIPPLSIQISVTTYTACLSIFKVMTTSISLKHKTEISITIGQKSPKEGCTRTPETTRSLLMNINGQQSTFLSDVNYKIKNINKKN